MAALAEDYSRATNYYEKVAEQSMRSNTMRYSVKEYLLKSGLCHLASHPQDADAVLAKYSDMDQSFPQEKEGRLLADLSRAVNDGKEEDFADALFKYDRISRLDSWKTTVCLRIKNAIGVIDEDQYA